MDVQNILNNFENSRKYSIIELNSLTDEEYNSIRWVMEAFGGRWNERCGGFKFDENSLTAHTIEQIRSTILNGGAQLDKGKIEREHDSFFPTPKNIVRKMIDLANIGKFDKLLESSAGDGRILDIVSEVIPKDSIVAIEPSKDRVKILQNKGYRIDYIGTLEDALRLDKLKERFKECNRVIINPPFKNDKDIKHLMLNYLICGEEANIVCIVQENSLYYNKSINRLFKEFLSLIGTTHCKIENLPYGSFKSEMTAVDTCIVSIRKKAGIQSRALELLKNNYNLPIR